jgi:G3E family GTPase
MTPVRLPVTVLSGFLGAGKTTVLRHLIRAADGRRLAVIVNDMAEANIDADLLRTGSALSGGPDRLVELANGCICCTLRDDLVAEVAALAAEGRFDALVIESTGVSEPMPVAAGFDLPSSGGLRLGDVAQLDTMVTVVDAAAFLADYASRDTVADRGLASGPGDARALVGLLTDQVEFADVLLINKADLVAPEALRRLHGILAALNPQAAILKSVHGQVPLASVIATSRYDPGRARTAAGWARAFAGNHPPESAEFGIGSFVWRARRPLHPGRFDALLRRPLPGVIRAKGAVWIASRHDWAAEWHLAGGQRRLTPSGPWWAARPRATWPQSAAWQDWAARHWQEPWGDRRIEIAFIGQAMPEAAIRAGFDDCLLDDAEMAGGPAAWRNLPDPFPPWS